MVEHYQGYTWRTALEESSLVLAHLFGRIPEIHFKRAWPVAQLTAMLGNVNGGKAKGGGSTPSWKLFNGQDFVPGYARPPGMDEGLHRLEPHHCALFAQALEQGYLKNASWVLQLTIEDDTLERINTVAEQYMQLEAGAPD